MTYIAHLPLSDAIGHINNGIGDALRYKIKQALMIHAEKVVEEMAQELCVNLKSHMEQMHNLEDGGITISLRIDGEKKGATR